MPDFSKEITIGLLGTFDKMGIIIDKSDNDYNLWISIKQQKESSDSIAKKAKDLLVELTNKEWHVYYKEI